MFGWEFPPYNSGGLGTACLGLTKALTGKGVEIVFVLPKKLPKKHHDFLKFASPDESFSLLYAINSPLSPYISAKDYRQKNLLPGSVYGRNLLEEVMRYAKFGEIIAKKEKFDVIHAHDWLSFKAGIRAKEVSGKPLVSHVHATEFDRGGGEGINSDVYAIEREGMHRADKIIAVSNFTKKILLEHYGVLDEKVEVVHNGIDCSSEKNIPREAHALKREGKKMVLFVGRITLQKGPDYFIYAAKKVCDITDDVFFVVSGSGDMEHRMIEEAARLGISHRVLFTGFLRGESLQKIYRMADLYVMPSVSEPFGITPLESLLNGTPVLISKQSGVSEVLNHALKIDFWNVEEMAGKIISVLKHRSLQGCLSSEGRREVKGITWDKAADKCIKIYGELYS